LLCVPNRPSAEPQSPRIVSPLNEVRQMVNEELIPYLTSTEYDAFRETDTWLDAKPSTVKKFFGMARKPVDFVYNKVPENIREKVADAILKVLLSVRDGTLSMVSVDKVYKRIEVHSGPIGDKPNFSKLGIRDLDQACLEGVRKSKNSCTVEGAATGVTGLPGIVVDVPALYGLLFHMIQEVAICYGFEVTPEEERSHILQVLNVGHHTDPAEKRREMDSLTSMQREMAQNATVTEVEKYTLQTMARHLARTLIQRKLAQSVVLVGGVVGAGVNRQLAGEVGMTAHHAYRRRFLLELALGRKERRIPTPESLKSKVSNPAPKSGLNIPKPPSYE